ncbi:MAG: FAD-binding oxidoreductase, partial [Mesorhizobium sp.]
ADGTARQAKCLVIAAGAWSHLLAKHLGDRIPLETERGYNTTLPKTAFDVKRQLIFSGHGFVVTPLETGVRVGGAVELGGIERPPNYARSKALLEKA